MPGAVQYDAEVERFELFRRLRHVDGLSDKEIIKKLYPQGSFFGQQSAAGKVAKLKEW